MPWVENWQAFERLFRCLSSTSMIDSIKDLHWDIRPSPHFGTVEVRVMDTPLTLAHAINIAGLIQATSHWLLTARPYKHQEQDFLLYRFNRFQACRYGLAGILTDARSGEQKTIAEDIARLLERVAPSAEKLGAASAIQEIGLMLKQGKSEAQRMRDFLADGGSLITLVQKHCELWATSP
jgi:carboxylate-amine ligase